MKLITGEVLEELKKLPTGSIDIGVTSPPYNKKEKNNGWLVKNVVYDNYVDKKPEKEYQKNQIEVLNELYRVIKPGGAFFYNHKVRTEQGLMLHPIEWINKTKWNIRQEIIWNRKIAGNIRGWRFWQIDERIYWLEKPIEKNKLIGREIESKHALLTSVWEIRPENSQNHPAAFPLQIPLRCIYSIMNGNKGVVIDPYSGSGTTGVAAKFLGLDYIGIDISKSYNDFAKKRIDNHLNESQIYNKEIQFHKVLETFSDKKAKGIYKEKAKNHSNQQLELEIN